MKLKLYTVIKQIHLYSTLLTVALLIMYIVTSYMMIYHDTFKVERNENPVVKVDIKTADINKASWASLLSKHHINGRLIKEHINHKGELIRVYESANSNTRIVISKNRRTAEIKTTELNLSGSIIGLHRMRGFVGSLKYQLYAFMLDITGVSLILFSVTGVILWLKLLKFNRIAWVIFFCGFLYVGAVIVYLWRF